MDRLEDIQTDVGCCVLHPVRITPLAVLLHADSTNGTAVKFEDKLFGAHIVTVTLRGRWRFHGRHGRHVLDPGTAMLGRLGDSYGCAHWAGQHEVNLIAALRSSALDEDEGPIFRRDCVPSAELVPLLARAAESSDDRFESTIFEAFERASQQSLAEYRGTGHLRMQRLKRFIEQHAGEQIGLAQMAEVTGLSPFTSVRQFKEATGRTPYAYLLECRLARARRLLALPRLSVHDAAVASGFTDQGYFARFFKRSTGLTPSQFRREAVR